MVEPPNGLGLQCKSTQVVVSTRAGKGWAFFGLLLLAWSLVACAPLMEAAGIRANETRIDTGAELVPGGDAARGAQALRAYGCDSCHTIPGIATANSWVGPPLTAWAERRYIAGKFPNQPDYLIEWIRFPQAIEPGTAMPNLGVTEQDARDISAYMYTLRGN